jgi:N6-L-threonylcarbamoyladenine synthase
MEAHALCARMQHPEIKFPFLCLLISGGHCLLAYVKDVDTFLLMGESLDDSPGEAFDKIARRLKLRNLPEFEYSSGGAAIEKAAKSATITGKYKFPLPLNRYRDCQFSFAGMKNSARRFIIQEERELDLVGNCLPDYPEFCASFLAAATRHLCHRTQRAIEYCEVEEMFAGVEQKTLVVSGGVASNDFIFTALTQMCNELGFKVYRPSKRLCTDNGVMIAWAGMEKIIANKIPVIENLDKLEVFPRCPLGENIIDKVKAKQLQCKWVKIPILQDFL